MWVLTEKCILMLIASRSMCVMSQRQHTGSASWTYATYTGGGGDGDARIEVWLYINMYVY
jgi:hypothetical protein